MLKGLKKFNKKAPKVMPEGIERGSQYKEKSVMLVQSIKNVIKFPKGLSQTNAGAVEKESIAVYAHYFDGELTMDALATLCADTEKAVREAGQVITGAEVIDGFTTKRFHALLTDEERQETIESIDPNDEYPVIALVMKKDRPGIITLDEYKALSEEEQVEYNPRANKNNATLEGIVGPDGAFSASAAYAELGGSCLVYEDEACTIETEVNREAKQYTKQLVFSLSAPIDFGGQTANVAFLIDTLGNTSKKGMLRGDKLKEANAAKEGKSEEVTGGEHVDIVETAELGEGDNAIQEQVTGDEAINGGSGNAPTEEDDLV